ncbi:TPA: GNAT family N-acetyltransferase [Streptococcus suis]
MESNIFEYSFLDWDSEFFNITTGRIILHEEISSSEMVVLNEKLKENQFTVIYNENNIPENNIWLGEETSARLVDINVQFIKMADSFSEENHERVLISQSLSESNEILQIASQAFKYSRFFNEPNLESNKTKLVYWNWVKTAFEKDGKYFAQYIVDSECQGFILFSMENLSLIIELIAVKNNTLHKGIGTKLLKSLEAYASEWNIEEIRVGTQLNNRDAVRFYTKNGYLYQKATSVYHHWLNEE